MYTFIIGIRGPRPGSRGPPGCEVRPPQGRSICLRRGGSAIGQSTSIERGSVPTHPYLARRDAGWSSYRTSRWYETPQRDSRDVRTRATGPGKCFATLGMRRTGRTVSCRVANLACVKCWCDCGRPEKVWLQRDVRCARRVVRTVARAPQRYDTAPRRATDGHCDRHHRVGGCVPLLASNISCCPACQLKPQPRARALPRRCTRDIVDEMRGRVGLGPFDPPLGLPVSAPEAPAAAPAAAPAIVCAPCDCVRILTQTFLSRRRGVNTTVP